MPSPPRWRAAAAPSSASRSRAWALCAESPVERGTIVGSSDEHARSPSSSRPISTDGRRSPPTDRPNACARSRPSTSGSTESGLSTAERLELWNDTEIALGEALSEAYLLSEAHPDAAVREIAERRCRPSRRSASRRLLDRDLWRVFADASADGLDADCGAAARTHCCATSVAGESTSTTRSARARAELTERDTELSLAFSRNVRDGRREITVAARRRWQACRRTSSTTHPADEDGLVTLTTEYTDLMPIREYATDRATRDGAGERVQRPRRGPRTTPSWPSCSRSALSARSCSATPTGPTTRPRRA